MARATDSEAKLASQLKRQLVNCVGYSGDDLAEGRRKAYDYYFQRPRGDELAGRSQIVTGDLSCMVEGNLAQCVEPLTNKRLADFCAYDADDEEQAQLESDCVHHMLFRKQNGFIEVSSSIKDCFLVRNGVIKVYVDQRTHVKQIRKSKVHAAVVLDLIEKIEKDVGGTVDVHTFDPQTGKLSATVKKTTRTFRCESIAPENFLVPKGWHRQDLFGIPFCAERHVEPRSVLIERGFDKDKVGRIRKFNVPYNSISDARRPRNHTPQNNAVDKSQDVVEWYECYVLMDDGNGASELHRISLADSIILEDDDETDLVSYATGVCIINPHEWNGISLYDKLKSTQDTTTAQTRALMDNLNANSKNRVAAFDEIVEDSDLTDARVNGVIRVKPGVVPDVRAAVTAFPVHDTSGNILANLEHMRRVRGEMGGAAVDMSTGEMQLNDRVGSQGLDRAYSAREAFAEFMTRILAHTLIRNMYLIAHEVLRTQWVGPIKFKRGKTWIVVEPSQWQVRDSVEMNLGKSKGERARLSQVYFTLMEKQAHLASAGMEDILVDAQAYYNAVIEWLRVNDVEVPERFVLDPRSPRAQQAFKRRAQMQQQRQAKQDALMREAIGLERVRTALTKYQTDAELQWKYYNTVISAQIEEAKLTAGAVLDWFKAKATAVTAALKGKSDDSDSKATAGSSAAGKPNSGGSSSESGE